MSGSESGGISKLVIKAYSDNKFASSTKEYTASINPENIEIAGGRDYYLSSGMGTPGMLRYNAPFPEILSLKLLFDNTGIIPGSEADVEEQIAQLKTVIYDVQEDTQAPSPVRVIWGKIDFKGRLADINISYTRFEAEGRPIRAEVVTRFIQEKEVSADPKGSSLGSDAAEGAAGAQDAAAAGAGAGAAGVGAQDAAAAGAGAGAGAAGGLDGDSDAAGAAGGLDGDPDAAAGGLDGDPDTAADGMSTHEGKDGETLPGVTNDALGDPGLAPDVADLNNLDSLRLPVPNLKLPFDLLALLAALVKKGLEYAKKGASWLKKKGGQAKDAAKKKAKEAAKKTKEKTKEAKDATKKKAKQAANVKQRTEDAGKATKEAVQKTKNMAKQGTKDAAQEAGQKAADAVKDKLTS